jgi:hypothetical protein
MGAAPAKSSWSIKSETVNECALANRLKYPVRLSASGLLTPIERCELSGSVLAFAG